MVWKTIETATLADAPFVAWVSPYGDPDEAAATIVRDCTLDATGAVVDADGEPVANVTHWHH